MVPLLEAGGILTYRKCHRNCSVLHFSSKLDVPSNLVQKKRVARILLFKIRPSQEILKIRDGTPLEMSSQEILKIRDEPSQNVLKIRDGTPLEAGGILTYRKGPRNCSVWHFSSKLDVPGNVVQKKRVARILVFKIRSSQEILKIRDGTHLEAEGILTYRKRPSKLLVARILVFKIRPSKEILKIRDGTFLEAEGILTYKKSPRNCSVWHFSSKLDVPSNVVQRERVARILVFKIRSSQEILKIRDGTPLKAEGILTYRKSPRNCSIWHFSSKLDVPSNVVQNKRVAYILVFKIRQSQEILKIVMVPLWSKLDVPSNLVQKKRVARILVFKIRPSQEILKIRDEPSQEILKIRDGTPLEAEGFSHTEKSPLNCSVWHFSSKLDVPSNVVQKKRVARILVFKIRSSQEILKIRDGTPLEAEGIMTYRKKPPKLLEILKIRDGTPLEKKRVARILVFKIRPSQEILKIRDGTPLEAEGFSHTEKSPLNCSVWHLSSKLDVPSNVVQKKRVARILVFKIRVARILVFKISPSQKILKIRDVTPLEAEGILTYKKSPRNCSVWHFSSKLDVPSNVVQKERLARILVFKIRPSQKILKVRDGTPLKAEGILTYRKSPRNCSVWHFSSKLDVPSNVVQKKRVACILVFKISPSQEILKIRDGTPLEAEGILTYRKSPRNCSVWHFSSKPSKEILKIRDGTPLEAEEILTYIKSPRYCSVWHFSSKPSQNVLKIRDGTPLKAEGILTYRKSPRNCSVWHFSSKLDVPSNVVQKKRVACILVFKISPSQEILKIRDGTPLEAEGILTYRKSPRNCSVWHFSSKPSKEILKIRDGTPLEAEEILTYIKSPRYCSVWPSQNVLKIRDGTPLKAEGILTYRKSPRNCSVWHFSSKLDVPSNVVQKKRVACILVFKIRPSQEILKIRDGTPLEAEGILTYKKSPRNCSVWHFSSKLDLPSNVVQKKKVERILVFKIRPSKEILKIRDGTPLEVEGILTYRKCHRNCSVLHFSSKLDVPSNLVQKKRVARILLFKIRPSQEILKIRDDVPSNLVQKKRVARILVFKIRPSQEILKIRDGTPLEAEGFSHTEKSPLNCSVWHFSSKLDVPSNVVQKKRVARILIFKIRSSQEILKIRDVAEGILTYRKSPRNCSVWHFSSKLDVPGNVVQKKRVARILLFKIRPSQEILKIRDGTPLAAEGILTYRKKPPKLLEPSQKILKIRDGTPLEAEGILTYKKSPRNCSVWHFSSKLDVPINVVQKERVARILVFKIRLARILVFKLRPSQKILKIRDGTPFEAEGILTYRKSPRNCSVWHFSSKLDVPSNVVQKERVAQILVFKIRPSQKILKIRDGTPLKAEGILTYRKSPRNCSVWHFSSKLDVPSNVVQKKRVACIMVFKIMPSQELLKIRDGTPLEEEGILTPSQNVLKIRDGTPLEAGGILTYRKGPRNCSVWHFSSKLDVPSNVVQKKRVARILLFKIRPSQEILKIRDGTPLEAEGILTYRKKPPKLLEIQKIRDEQRVARILVFKIRPSQKILKIRDGTPLEAEGILTYRKSPRNCSIWHFSSKLDVPSNVVQKERVARILVFKIRPSQKILKIRDGTPLEAEGILTYKKSPRNCSVWHFSSKLDVPSNVVQKERLARILVFKIRPSQKILKIRDGTPLKAEGILTYRKSPRNCSVWHFSSKLDVPSNVVQKKRVACILVFKIRPSQEILKIRDGTPLEAEGILTYRKSPRNCSVWHFSSKLDVPRNVVQKKRVERILVFKIRPSKEILKIRDGTPLEAEEILTYIKSPQYCSVWHFSSKSSQNVLKIRDGTPLEAGGILTYRKGPRNCSVWHFSSKLDVPGNVVQKKRVARILLFKIRPSQEILKIRDGTPLEAEGILTYRKKTTKLLGLAISKILKIRDGTPLEAGGILTYRKGPRNCSVWHFSSKLDVPGNVVQKKRVARILLFKIRPSQEILKIRDGTPLEAEGILTYRKKPPKLLVARIMVFKIRSSQEILEIRDGTPLEAEGILTYRKKTTKLLVARILVFKIGPSQKILKIRDGTPLKAEEILTYRKSPRNCSVWHFSSKLDVPSNVVQKKRVACILVFKIRPSQEILKIRDGTPLEAEGILTYRKSPRNCSVWHFSSKLDVPSNVVQKKRVERILVFKIRPSKEILKIRDGTPLEADEILTYRKSPRYCSVWHFSSKPSQKILKIRDGTPLEAEGILTYRKSPRNYSVWHFSSKLDVPSNVVQKERVAQILVFKIRPSQKILKIRDGTPLKAEGILTYRKSPRKCSVWHFSSKLDVPSNVVQKKRVACIMVFKIMPSHEILKIRDGTPWEWPPQNVPKIRDGTPLEAGGILTYRKGPRNCSVWHFSSKLDVPGNVVQKKRVARILLFKIRPSQEILKIRDGTPLEAEGILTYRKKPPKLLGLALF
ncbi:hypothetical protein OROMI_024506 [Orobanche minor]